MNGCTVELEEELEELEDDEEEEELDEDEEVDVVVNGMGKRGKHP